VGNALVRAGRFDEALTATRAALAAGEQAFGAMHPEVGVMHGRVATAWIRQGDYDRAAEHSQRAVEILRAALGSEHPNVAVMMVTLGQTELRRGRLAEAEATFRGALPSVAGSLNEAIVLSALCDVAREQGDDASALVHARRSRELREALLGPDDSMVALGLLVEGLALSRVDRHDEAFVALARARGMHERRPLPPIYEAIMDAYEGRAHLRAGRPLEALPRLERALARQQELGAEPLDRADVRFHLVQALWAVDRQDEARAQLAVVAEELRPLGTRADHRFRSIRAWVEEHGVSHALPSE
jgi:serine/threonine-protein kinase